MRRPPLYLVLALILAGCSVQLAPAPELGRSAGSRAKASQAPRPSEAPPAGEATAADLAPQSLGGLTFKELAPENARYAGGVGGAMPGPAPMPAPIAMSPGGMPGPYGRGEPVMPAGLTSGNMNGGYGYAYGYGPGGGGGEPTTLVSLTQSEAAGSRGPYKDLLTTVIRPVITDWASDAKLLTSNATTGNDGLLTEPGPPPEGMPPGCEAYYGAPNETAWRLTYFSASRSEMLNFYVTPARTLIVRARWAPLDLDGTPVAVDNDVALRSLVAAIETQGFQGEEEKSGLDYFMGGTFGQRCDGPMPMKGPPMPVGKEGEFRTEVVYDVPDNARWNVNLQVILHKPVWELTFYAQPDASPMPVPMKMPSPGVSMPPYEDPGFNFNNSARGLVDATTGAVIRFNRPSKHYYPRPVMGMHPTPYPMPAYSPTPPPQDYASATPSPSPSPTPEATEQ